ncbi:MAG: transcriptional regulator [Clostridiales bacterium]|nr:transcriptional regulator [Clostridiales bacterium]
MMTTLDYIEYVCEQIGGTGLIRYKKMFGEYMVYVNDKPLLLVCGNIVYVKILDCISDKMKNAEKGFPYNGAKEHYILDIDNAPFSREIVSILEPVTPLPKPKSKLININTEKKFEK